MEEGRTGSRDFTVVITDPGPGPVVIQPALTEFRLAVEMERLLDLVGQTLADWPQIHRGVKVRAALPIVEDGFTSAVHVWYGGELRSSRHAEETGHRPRRHVAVDER